MRDRGRPRMWEDRLPTRAYLEKELDKVCGWITRKSGVCLRCGKRIGQDLIEDHHIIKRGNHAVRWDLENHMPLCHECHQWAENNPILFDEFAKEKLGELRWESLHQRSLAIRMWKRHEMAHYLQVLRRQMGLNFSNKVMVEV